VVQGLIESDVQGALAVGEPPAPLGPRGLRPRLTASGPST
jgi:hypothetical protein